MRLLTYSQRSPGGDAFWAYELLKLPTLRRHKDTLAPVFFVGETIASSSPEINATVCDTRPLNYECRQACGSLERPTCSSDCFGLLSALLCAFSLVDNCITPTPRSFAFCFNFFKVFSACSIDQSTSSARTAVLHLILFLC